jgi:hypothetical protein
VREHLAEEEWRFLRADLRAAAWVLETEPDTDAETLLRKFLSLHQHFVKNIGRERPDLFSDVASSTMCEVVQRWIVLYRRSLAALHERFPRVPGTPDLSLGGVNWSALLGVTFHGILHGTSHASRYAEYWAEKSIKSREVLESFDARLRFVATPAYWTLLDLAVAKRLTVLDPLANAVTSFDLVHAAAAATGAGELRDRFTARGWSVDALDDEAAAAMIAGNG